MPTVRLLPSRSLRMSPYKGLCKSLSKIQRDKMRRLLINKQSRKCSKRLRLNKRRQTKLSRKLSRKLPKKLPKRSLMLRRQRRMTVRCWTCSAMQLKSTTTKLPNRRS